MRAYQRDMTIDKFRLSHPGCVIKSPNIMDVHLDMHTVILEGAVLNKVDLGSFSYVERNSRLSNVDIGKFCSIGPSVQIGLARHPTRVFVSTYPAFYSNQNGSCPLNFRSDKVFDDSVPKTCIGSDVWIGSDVIVPGGVRIGTGAIVAAGSVVVNDVLPYAVVGGNPAKLIRFRFSDEQIGTLLGSEWWNWPIEKIRSNIDCFVDIEKFRAMTGEIASKQ